MVHQVSWEMWGQCYRVQIKATKVQFTISGKAGFYQYSHMPRDGLCDYLWNVLSSSFHFSASWWKKSINPSDMLSYQLLICFGYLQRVREVFGADVKFRSCLLTCHHSKSKTNTPAPAKISPRVLPLCLAVLCACSIFPMGDSSFWSIARSHVL